MLFCVTIDHLTIVSWAFDRGASPSTIEGDDHPWPLLFDFRPPSPGMVTIGWQRFFEQFEGDDLAFIFPYAAPDSACDMSYQFVKRAALPHLTFSGKSTILERIA
ncbi:MAG TPA: hypothetical protein VKW08_11040 [Xanthobacteraceae bacterium]|jgi:hypothetical protein|nr:hypothetical protein [Xanthobacteraceae bacterium]